MPGGFEQQFQRSVQSPLQEITAPRLELDGAVVLDKYTSAGSNPTEMSGAEFYAVIGHIKRQHGPKGDALEAELMKISRQKDKKIRLGDWISEHHGPPPSMMAPPSIAPPPQPMTPGAGANPAMPRLNLGAALGGGGDVPAAAAARPMTARPDYQNAGSQMAGLLGSPRASEPSGSMTARPSTAPAPVAPAADMSVVFSSFVAGRDHAKMSGGEYHSLVAWLKSKGHGDVEDMLMKVRLLGDKKFQLAKYMKEKCADLQISGAAGAAVTQEHYAMPPLPPPVAEMPPPQQAPPPQYHAPPPQQQPAYAYQPPPAAHYPPPAQQPAYDYSRYEQPQLQQAGYELPPPPPVAVAPAGNMDELLKGIATLEQTIGRMDESFTFAVECMKEDMNNAKSQLAALRLAAGVPQ